MGGGRSVGRKFPIPRAPDKQTKKCISKNGRKDPKWKQIFLLTICSIIALHLKLDFRTKYRLNKALKKGEQHVQGRECAPSYGGAKNIGTFTRWKFPPHLSYYWDGLGSEQCIGWCQSSEESTQSKIEITLFLRSIIGFAWLLFWKWNTYYK